MKSRFIAKENTGVEYSWNMGQKHLVNSHEKKQLFRRAGDKRLVD